MQMQTMMGMTTRTLIAILAAGVCISSGLAEGVVVTGRILGADSGQPLPVEAWIIGRNTSTGEWTGAAISKHGDDSYRLELPSAGRYVLYPTYGPFWYDEWDLHKSNEFAAQAFEVEADGQTTQQDLTLPDPVPVRMNVVDAASRPLKGARVCLSRMSPEYERDYGAISLSREIDAEGRCEWLAVPGHEVWVSASAEGYTWEASEHFEAKRGDDIPEITLTLRRPGTITATLVDIDGHPKPKTNYRLAVHDLQGAYLKGSWATTDAKGQIVARDFLVRDKLRVSLFSSSKQAPDWEMIYDGPADRDLAMGSVYVPGLVQP